MAVQSERTPVTIVCVFNDPEVLESCLARSVRAGSKLAPETELIPMDNQEHAFATAGAALNAGARQAKNDVVVFVHQDVILHSLVALEEAAAILMRSPQIGIIGAVGMDAHDRVIGRIRDRVVQIGEPSREPRDVDSLDEVLFMIRRELVLREPLSEDPILAWHAYGVEYCLRMRRASLRATALDIPLTHNSLTTNLDKLDVAHRKVGADYPQLLPIRTTCGVVRSTESSAFVRNIRRSRGAAIWWNESLLARSLAKVSASSPVVLADIRLVIDEAAAIGSKRSIKVLDVAAPDSVDTSASELSRFGVPFSVEALSVSEVRARVDDMQNDELLLISGLRPSDMGPITSSIDAPHVIGHSRDTGIWMLVGVPADVLRPLWSQSRNRPFAGLLPDSAGTRTIKSDQR